MHGTASLTKSASPPPFLFLSALRIVYEGIRRDIFGARQVSHNPTTMGASSPTKVLKSCVLLYIDCAFQNIKLAGDVVPITNVALATEEGRSEEDQLGAYPA